MYNFYKEGEKGFTLIEVLASMAVLIVILLALVRLFDEASRAYDEGTTSVSRSAAARAAMEMITRDLEGAVIDRRLQFYKEAQTVFNDFDELFCVTMEGSPEDGRSYQLVHYYVDTYTATNAGVKYQGFRLMRGAVDTDVVEKKTGIHVLSNTNPWDWWKNIPDNWNPVGIWNPVIVADNIVRFDLYALSNNGNLHSGHNGWIGGEEINGYYSSATSTPPVYMDVYLQVTSDEAMKKGGANLLAEGDPFDRSKFLNASSYPLWQEGRSLMYRESSVLVTRVHPTMWAAQIAHPIPY